MFVLDASVALSWCFEDEMDDYNGSVLDAFRSWEALVPSLWSFEMVNGLISAERRRRINARQADDFLRLVLALPIQVEKDVIAKGVLGVARASKLSAYDAAYLDLASRHAAPLATNDRQLTAAAAATGVTIFRP